MSRTLLVLMLVLLAHTAQAADRLRDPWRGYHSATWVALSGELALGAGALTLGLGLPMVVEGPDHTPPGAYGIGMVLYTGGYLALATSGGLMSGGSLAARQFLVRRAGLHVPVWPSLIATGAWGTTLALAVIAPAFTGVRPLGWLTLTTFATTHVLGTVQLILNRHAWRSLPDGALPSACPPRAVTMRVAPQVGRRTAGLAILGSF